MGSQHYSIGAKDGATYWVIGDRITFKLTGAETNGQYLIVEIVSEPDGGPWFLHTHPPQETFYVLDGEFEIYYQDESGNKQIIQAKVGDLTHVPGGVPHGFKNVGGRVGKMLVTYEPASMMFDFFREIGISMVDRDTLPNLDGPLDVENALAIMRQHGMEIIENPAEA